MKTLIPIALSILFATPAFATEVVRSAKLDASKKNLLIDVVYGGGCREHVFELNVGDCVETVPVQCSAQLVDLTTDYCESLIFTTVVISLEEAGLTDEYYRRAKLTIQGDKDRSGKPSQAVVWLP